MQIHGKYLIKECSVGNKISEKVGLSSLTLNAEAELRQIKTLCCLVADGNTGDTQ